MTHQTWKTIGNIIFYTLASFLFAFFMMELLFPSKTMDVLGFKGYVVVSPSMEPEIKVNDLVIVTKVNEDDLEVGQIITFYTYLPTIYQDDEGHTIYQKNTVTHYLAEITEEDGKTIIKTKDYTKYHNNGSYDTWRDINGDPVELTTEDIIGKVSFVIPWIGIIITIAMVIVRNPIFLGLIVLNVTIIIILIRYIKKSKGQTNDVGRPDSN
jgi:signal peptidase I